MVNLKKQRKAGIPMEKQRLFKMSALERDILAKALDDTQKEYHPKQAEQMRALMDKTIQAPKRKLYLNDDEFQWAVFALNSVRNTYLSAGRSSGGFDRILLKLLNSKYKYAPTR